MEQETADFMLIAFLTTFLIIYGAYFVYYVRYGDSVKEFFTELKFSLYSMWYPTLEVLDIHAFAVGDEIKIIQEERVVTYKIILIKGKQLVIKHVD